MSPAQRHMDLVARAGCVVGNRHLGTKRFCSLYGVPGESEYGLLVWANEDIAKLRIAA